MITPYKLLPAICIVSLFFTDRVCKAAELYEAPAPGTRTRWISPENFTGEKGGGGMSNNGAKGNAFMVVNPGSTTNLADIQGAGIIQRMWLSGDIPKSAAQRRLIRIEMYWDGAKKPAVSCPIGDFFGLGLGLSVPYENALFSNPEGRSFNFTIPMPYRKGARIVLVNESSSYTRVWYDINYLEVKQHPRDVMYFHAAWRRESPTVRGRDFEILPRVTGRGRYLGANIGVIGGNPEYRGTWFGEGEVKIYMDGDKEWPTLVGTGTEDYIGTGWGQGVFQGRYSGSLVSDKDNDIYAFYRFHLNDPVYFEQDCRVTIQQMGNTSVARVREMLAKGVPTRPLWVMSSHGDKDSPSIYRLLEQTNLPAITDPGFPSGGCHYWREDDVSATVYFYLDRPQNDLPALAPAEFRVKGLKETVWEKLNPKR